MGTKIIRTEFQFKRGLAEAWAQKNPILRVGEPGFEYDTYKFKIGDGVKAWNDLPYIGGNVSISPDGKSIIINSEGEISLYGFDSAEVNYVLSKGEDGKIKWVKPSEDERIPDSEIHEIIDN